MGNFVSIKNYLGSIFQYLSLLFKDPRINRFYTYYTKFYFVNNVYKHKIWQVHILILPIVSGTNMCFWKAYCPIAGKIILIILVGTGRRFVYCVWLCFGNILMSVATINNVHSYKFQWNFFFWRKWVCSSWQYNFD